MFDHFLTDLLKIVILLDVLGVVAYFLLGAVRRKAEAPERLLGLESSHSAVWENASPAPAGFLRGLHGQTLGRLRRLSPSRLSWFSRKSAVSESLDESLAKLRRVLNSYREGLA